MPEHGEMAFPSPLGEAWHVGELPFFVQCQDVPNNSLFGLPDRMPFVLECDSDTGTLRQRRNDEVDRALERAYSFGSLITGTMDDTGIGRRYAEDFLRFFLDSVGSDLRGKRILEVGCGTGYFLSLLRERGADVLGVEPGPQGQRGGEKYGVPVVRNFFPCEEVRGRFDVVVAYAVLEHMTAPEVFLKATGGFLNEGGCLLLAVPDCEPYLGQGDISCLLPHPGAFTLWRGNKLILWEAEELIARRNLRESSAKSLIFRIAFSCALDRIFLRSFLSPLMTMTRTCPAQSSEDSPVAVCCILFGE